jgi:hypothetical protein
MLKKRGMSNKKQYLCRMKNEVRYRVTNRNLSNRKEVKEVYHYEAKPSIYPVFEKYPYINLYAYCMNNPVRFIDPESKDEYEIFPNGKTVKVADNSEKDIVYGLNKKGERANSKRNKCNNIQNTCKCCR